MHPIGIAAISSAKPAICAADQDSSIVIKVPLAMFSKIEADIKRRWYYHT